MCVVQPGREAEDSSAAKGMNLAKSLLQKMGWKEGDGLGRNRQGISAPLVAQKTDRRAGVIVQGEPSNQPPRPGDGAPAAEKKPRVVRGRPVIRPMPHDAAVVVGGRRLLHEAPGCPQAATCDMPP